MDAQRPRVLLEGRAIWGAALTAAVLILVAIGPLFARYPPIDFVGAPFESPSLDLPLGADIMGRDVLSRVLSGGTVILSLSALATVLGVALGGLLGISAGYFKGVADDSSCARSVLLAFPQTILALLFVSVLGSSFFLIAVLVAAIHAPQVARVIRAAALRCTARISSNMLEVSVHRHTAVQDHGSGDRAERDRPLLVEVGLRFTYSIALIAGLSFWASRRIRRLRTGA